MASATKAQADERARVFIGMGSNLGDSPETLRASWELLGEDEKIHLVTLSSPYASAPVDMHSQHWFTNAVGELRTALTPGELLAKLMAVEATLGRVRGEHAFGYQDRTIDLDLLYYGPVQLDEPELVLPHPHLHDRLFVLAPLAEIAPDFIDPRRQATVIELLEQLQARLAAGGITGQEISRSSWPE